MILLFTMYYVSRLYLLRFPRFLSILPSFVGVDDDGDDIMQII